MSLVDKKVCQNIESEQKNMRIKKDKTMRANHLKYNTLLETGINKWKSIYL